VANTRNTAKHLLALAFAVLCLALPATVQAASPMLAAAGPTSIPIGALEFCKSRPVDCGANRKVVDAVRLDDKNWAQLLSVNTYFNDTIVPISDEDLYHVTEYWTYPAGYGDCEDIALAKRRELIADGWPASALLMSVVKQANGEGHAVLLVRTDRGDLVLDNQDGRINLWSDTPYHFVKRQSQTNASQWVDVLDDRPIIVATAGR